MPDLRAFVDFLLSNPRETLPAIAADPRKPAPLRRLAAHGAWLAPDSPLEAAMLPLAAPLGTLGLANEGMESAGDALAGEAFLLAMQPLIHGPGADTNPALADLVRASQHGAGHPGRVLDELRRSDDKLTSYVAGATSLAANPGNFLAPAAKAAQARNLPRLAAVLGAADEAQTLGAGKGIAALAERRAARRAATVAANASPDLDSQAEALAELLQRPSPQSTGLVPTPSVLTPPSRLAAIAPDLDIYLRSFLRDPATFDPQRFRAEALANSPAQSFNRFAAEGWPRLQAGAVTPDEVLGAAVPTRLSIRRGGVGDAAVDKLQGTYPELLPLLDRSRVIGGEDAGKLRPEDIAAHLLMNTDEGRAVARAIKQGDHGALGPALERFRKVWPGSIMGYDEATLHDLANKLNPLTEFLNDRASRGAAPGNLADELIQGGIHNGKETRPKGIAAGKVPFMLNDLGAGQQNPTFDSQVIKRLVGGATPATYRTFLRALYPEELVAGITDGMRHQFFWDSIKGGGMTGHEGKRAIMAHTRAGGTLGAAPPGGLMPAGMARALVGAGAGGIAGGVGGFATEDDGATMEERLDRAMLGAIAGLGLGGAVANPRQLAGMPRAIAGALAQFAKSPPAQLQNTLFEGALWREAFEEGALGWQAAKGTPSAGAKDFLKGGDAQWRRQIVTTLRNLQLDAGTLWIALKEFGAEYGVTRADVLARVAENRAARQAERAAPGSLDKVAKLGAVGQDLADLGLVDLIDDAEGLADLLGTNPIAAMTGGAQSVPLSRWQRTVAGAGIGWASGATKVSPVAPLIGAARGYFDPFITSVFSYLNGLQHNSFREAMFRGALARDLPGLAGDFLDNLDAAGVDTAALRAKGWRFSADEVKAAVGATNPALADQMASDWRVQVEGLVRKDAQAVNHLAGDFSDKTKRGKLANWSSRIFPFSSWAINYAPTLAKIAVRHPIATSGVLLALIRDAQAAEREGRKGYSIGTIPISTEAPLIGGLVRARLGGQQGTLRLDPLAAVLPWGGELIAGIDAGEDKTLYENAKALAAPLGLNPHPIIDAAAFAFDQNFATPGGLSRTKGVEEALGELLGDLGVPSLPGSQVALNALRGRVSPDADQASGYDPVLRRYAELYFAKYGRTLSDPKSRKDLTEPIPDLWEQAEDEVARSGLVGGLLSVGTPLSATAQSRERVAADKAKSGLPHPYGELQGLSGPAKTKAEKENEAYTKKNPAADTHKNAHPLGRARAMLAQWEAENSIVRKVDPERYARERAAERKRLGLK